MAHLMIWLGLLLTLNTPLAAFTPLAAQNISVPIDHFNTSDHRTYNNRFWINSTFYKPNGPVILYDFGESGVTAGVVEVFLQESAGSTSSVMEIARRFNGLVIGWEHRFFGYAAYKYLTVDQALQDVVYLANHFQPTGLQKFWTTLSPRNSPWLFVGGSYPGARAAWIRARNPETIYASWASSSVVQWAVSGHAYFDAIYRLMPANCSVDMEQLIKHLDSIFSSGSSEQVQQLQEMTYIVYEEILSAERTFPANPTIVPISQQSINKSATELTHYEIGSLFAQALIGNFQYTGYQLNTGYFCDALESFDFSSLNATSNNQTEVVMSAIANPGDAKPSSKGIVGSHGVSTAFYALLFATRQSYLNSPYAPPTDGDDAAFYYDVGWDWLVCNELGLFRVSDPANPNNKISIAVSVAGMEQHVCKRLFPFPGLPPLPHVSTVQKYGGWNINPSNVYFGQGEIDPDRAFTPLATERQPQRPLTTVLPKCNIPPPGDAVFGFIYEGASHAADLYSIPGFTREVAVRAVETGIDRFSAALEKWLPCFGT